MYIQLNKIFTVILILTLAGCFSPTKKSHLPGFETVKYLGYSFHKPFRNGYGSGTVFRVIKTSDGNKSVQPICNNLFTRISYTEDVLALTEETFENNTQIDLGLGIVNDLFAESPKLDILNKNFKSINLKYNGVKEKYFTLQDVIDAKNGNTISSSCNQAIKELMDDDGKLKYEIYIIQNSLSFESIDYKFISKKESGSKLAFNLKDLFSFKAGIESNPKSRKTLTINKKMNFAFKPYPIEDVLFLTRTGEPIAIIKVGNEPTKIDLY